MRLVTLASTIGIALVAACDSPPSPAGDSTASGEAPKAGLVLPSIPAPAERRVAEAIAAASAAVRAEPRSALAWGRLGMVLDAHDYRPQATESYREAATLDPQDFRWAYHLAVLADQEGVAASHLVERFERAARLEDGYPALYYRLSVALQRQGLYAQAEVAAERLVEVAPELGAAWRQLGRVRLARGRDSEALAALERAEQLGPDDARTLSALSQAQARLGDAGAALETARRARRAEVESEDATMPDPIRAQIGSLGVSANRAYERGQSALEAGDLALAIDLLEIKVDVSPSPSSLYLLGVAHRRSGNGAEADLLFRRAIELSDHPGSHWQLGALLIDEGRRGDGASHLLRARDLAGEDGALLHAVGSDLARQGLLPDAIEAFAASAAIDGSNAALETDWCGALLQQGSFESALEHCRRAVRIDPASSRAHLHLGMSLEATGRPAEALEHYRRSVELDPASRANELLDRERPSGAAR